MTTTAITTAITTALPQLNRRSLLKIGAVGAAVVPAMRLSSASAVASAAAPRAQTLNLGMSTEWSRWSERVSLTGPVSVRRCYVPSWNIGSLLKKVETCLDQGVLPYASMKFGTDWDNAASGAMDAEYRDLARALAGLNAKVRMTFHHEPRSNGVQSPQQLVPWARANTRAYRIMREVGVPKVVLGPTDNGFPWSENKAQQSSDEELAVYYTQEFLGECDAIGADFYDGSSNNKEGEPAYVKMARFAKWAQRVEFPGLLDVGEWNFVGAADVGTTLKTLQADRRWWAAALFNSAANNRDDLPPELNGSWELRPKTARLAEFREMLQAADPRR